MESRHFAGPAMSTALWCGEWQLCPLLRGLLGVPKEAVLLLPMELSYVPHASGSYLGGGLGQYLSGHIHRHSFSLETCSNSLSWL